MKMLDSYKLYGGMKHLSTWFQSYTNLVREWKRRDYNQMYVKRLDIRNKLDTIFQRIYNQPIVDKLS